MTISEWGLTEWILVVTTVAAVLSSGSALIIYFNNKKLVTKQAESGIAKTSKEIESIEQETEARWANQIKKWYDDIQEIKSKHDIALAGKDAELSELHTQYIHSLKELEEQRIRLNNFNRGTRKILVTMDIAYWETDGEGNLEYANGAWLKLFGLQLQDALGHGWIKAVVEDEQRELLLDWAARVVDGVEGSVQFTVENAITRDRIRVKSLYAMVLDADDKIYKIIGITVPVPRFILQNL